MKKWMQKNPALHLVCVLWRHAAGFRGRVLLYGLMAALAMGVSLLRPLVLAKLMNGLQQYQGDALLSSSLTQLVLFFGLGVLFWCLHGPSRVLETVTAFRIKQAFRRALMHQVTSLSLKWHKENHSGETISQMEKATAALSGFMEGGFELIHLLTRFIGATVMLTLILPLNLALILVSALLAAMAIVRFDRKLIKQQMELDEKSNRVSASIQDYLTNISTVISLRLEDFVTKEVDTRSNKMLPLYAQNSKLNELKWFTTSRFIDLTQVLVIGCFIAYSTRSGKVIEIGTMYALLEYIGHIAESFFSFTWKYGDLVVRSIRVHSIDHIGEAFEREVKAIDDARLPEGWKQLEIGNVHFAHSDEEAPALRIAGTAITLQRGRSYALIGASGGGKSTLLKLLRGLFVAKQSEVRCDGVLLPQGLAHVAHHATLIPQDPEIFADSIRFNITLGVEAEEARIRRAAELACFDRVLARLPLGLESHIAEKGVDLSGGEKQRLALTRGLYFAYNGKSELVLLDEPTSSVDKGTEWRIYTQVLESFEDRCVVMALHNLDLLPLFDEVLVFSEGTLVEQGAVHELLGRQRKPWELASTDSDRFTRKVGT